MSKELEIERRFLLKRAPELEFESINQITQVYVDEDGTLVRYRGETKGGERRFTRTVKTDVKGSFVREEVESDTTQEEFIKKAQKSDKIITKIRSIYDDGKVKWELDQFRFFDLIIIEVELPSEDFKLDIPKEIMDVMIMEVTNMSEFHNYTLADDYEKA